jgi:hypothetical protein
VCYHTRIQYEVSRAAVQRPQEVAAISQGCATLVLSFVPHKVTNAQNDVPGLTQDWSTDERSTIIINPPSTTKSDDATTPLFTPNVDGGFGQESPAHDEASWSGSCPFDESQDAGQHGSTMGSRTVVLRRPDCQLWARWGMQLLPDICRAGNAGALAI